MNKEELIKKISELIQSENWYTISDEYNIWDTWYGFTIVGTVIILSLAHRNDLRAFKTIIRDNGSKSPIFDNIDYQTAIDLLFNHYPYGHTDWSNCFLIDDSNQIFWISWNKSEHNSFIKAHWIVHPGYILINKTKKLDYNLYVEDIWGVTNFLNNLKFNK